MKIQTHDLTTGSLGKSILFFSIPLMLSNLLQVLFNIADVAVVGRFAGNIALGSVGSTSILISLFIGFLLGIGGGINVLVALNIGAANKKDTRESVQTAFLTSLVIGILLLIVGWITSRPILTAMRTKPELMEGAVLYMRIYFLALPASAIYNCGNAVLSAAGDTKRPLRYLTCAGVLNVILNLLFVIVFHLDVAGVAIASVIAQYLSAALITRALFSGDQIYSIRFSGLSIHKDKLLAIMRLGIPCGIQNIVFQFANLFVQRGVNSFSAIVVAGNAAATNADAPVYDVMAAFYVACSSFMGQNLGAKKRDRVRKSYLISLAYSFFVGLLLGLFFVFMGPLFLGLFSTDSEVIAAGMQRLTIMGLSYAVSAFMDCTIAASRGLGKTIVPTIIVIMGSCVFRVVWIYTIFAHYQTISSLYLLYIFSWSITAILEIIYFIRIFRKQNIVLSNQ